MKTRVIGATEFKARCLALLDEIDEQGGTITVTKRGRPVATISPAPKKKSRSPIGILEGKLKDLVDIMDTDISIDWGMVRRDKGSPF